MLKIPQTSNLRVREIVHPAFYNTSRNAPISLGRLCAFPLWEILLGATSPSHRYNPRTLKPFNTPFPKKVMESFATTHCITIF